MVPQEIVSRSNKRGSVVTMPPGSFRAQSQGRMSPEFLDMSSRRVSIMALAPGSFIPQQDPDASSDFLAPPLPKRASIMAISLGTDAQRSALSPELLESSSKRGSIVAITPGKYHPFFGKSKEATIARKTYLRIYLSGSLLTIMLIFGIFSLFWGALWKIPAHPLSGIVVDFDQGIIGQNFTQYISQLPPSKIFWSILPASQFPGGSTEVGHAILQEKSWVAITVNEGSSARLAASLASPNAAYNGTTAVTAFGVEGRNENGFRNLLSPATISILENFSMLIATQTASKAANMTHAQLVSLLTNSPQTLVQPVYYQFINLAPFSPPVAQAVTFVGLILELILSYFLVMMGSGAREASRLDKTLSTRSLIILRYVSSFASYLVVSLFYSLLSLAFKLPLTRKFGHSGFLVFWGLNYAGMLSVGMALEAMVTLLTPKFIAFFMLVWIITNISVTIWPIEVLPRIFHYGYGAPFYNISRAMRTILFSTKNRVGFEFGILLAWIALSCVTMPLIQIFVRRKFQPVDVTQLTVVQEEPNWKKEADRDRNRRQ
ncbi:hypothetical protein HYPSUDRAFT_214573 [Hypholoma sublateritium FD-334 SS-4]|uniref:DUF3533 domain-containing protein n=1 Tax=Hypholoma sublateritium (strain FD-334 SS-4) TaxID=945553 RepID=A0A0D2LAW2_HYPSF|nr:hypothetical protein HYPSUDRAFT_214573 [Hypholoma sublateritium FD-334 SS-4]